MSYCREFKGHYTGKSDSPVSRLQSFVWVYLGFACGNAYPKNSTRSVHRRFVANVSSVPEISLLAFDVYHRRWHT
ncbi:hypothetical protein JTE90_028256 [Oedothorax gibbosus]|uniref:Uncharacterized protein n=1 Tax=Oedothorax gibbosus TaxID=931172 RepID=A0AAV6UR61_9ARAC|nr:hypothetical protein JTE90_028256 [Oedothorax gibbosus]